MMHRMALLVVVGTLATGGAAWAGTKSHSIDVTLSALTMVRGQRIPAGDYRLSWAGDSSNVHVTFERGEKVVAQVDGKIETLAQPSPEQELVTRTTKDGARALEEVRLRNQKTALVFPVS